MRSSEFLSQKSKLTSLSVEESSTTTIYIEIKLIKKKDYKKIRKIKMEEGVEMQNR